MANPVALHQCQIGWQVSTVFLRLDFVLSYRSEAGTDFKKSDSKLLGLITTLCIYCSVVFTIKNFQIIVIICTKEISNIHEISGPMYQCRSLINFLLKYLIVTQCSVVFTIKKLVVETTLNCIFSLNIERLTRW